ncbi:MAG: formylglycine-generating enzyme family protein [Rhodothermales bacterium]
MTTKFARTLIALCVGACMAAPWTAAGQAAGQTVVTVPDEAVDLEPYQVQVHASLVDLDMIPIPPGSIRMEVDGEPEPVDVGSFWMSRAEVPWDLFDVYAFGSDQPEETEDGDAILQPSRPYGAPDRGFGHRGYAAISMTFLVAEEFTEWLSTITGDTYRLPTEAEWEYACRAGREADLPEEELEEVAWYWDNAFDETHPIGELAPNAFGLHDMIGNAAEWCVGMDGEPLACGGSYMDRAEDVGCGARKAPSPKWQETDPQIPKSRFWLTDGPFMGFRVIRVP